MESKAYEETPNSKWTPGPWISERDVRGKPPDAGCGVIASDDDVRISNPSRGIVAWANRRVGQSNAETLANARLISAAPEIAEALAEQLNEHYATWMAARAEVEGASTSHALFEKEPATIRARAALRKAGYLTRGET